MQEELINRDEVRNMLCGIGESEILEDEIQIIGYPFEPSIVYPNMIIGPNDIDAICWKSYPPAIKIEHEYIFVSREHFDKLKQFAERHEIQTFETIWTWQWILEPYLDTEYTEETNIRLCGLLNKSGISNIEVQALREEVKDQMIKYNFDTMLWEWVGLGLEDVLAAMRVKYSKEKFEDFYKRAMKIQFRNVEYDT